MSPLVRLQKMASNTNAGVPAAPIPGDVTCALTAQLTTPEGMVIGVGLVTHAGTLGTPNPELATSHEVQPAPREVVKVNGLLPEVDATVALIATPEVTSCRMMTCTPDAVVTLSGPTTAPDVGSSVSRARVAIGAFAGHSAIGVQIVGRVGVVLPAAALVPVATQLLSPLVDV